MVRAMFRNAIHLFIGKFVVLLESIARANDEVQAELYSDHPKLQSLFKIVSEEISKASPSAIQV